MGLVHQLNLIASVAVSAVRWFSGRQVRVNGEAPTAKLELFEFENCPYCRKVRELLTELDLDVLIFPCPKGGERFRPELIRRAGKAQFPYLVDGSTGKQMYESRAIIAYLRDRYGSSTRAGFLQGLRNVGGSFASALRYGHGMFVRPSRAPDQALQLWSFEASPFSRLVRERLCELELSYQLHNIGKGSTKRKGFEAQHGRIQVPYLEDPNTGQCLFESQSILEYLEKTYSV